MNQHAFTRVRLLMSLHVFMPAHVLMPTHVLMNTHVLMYLCTYVLMYITCTHGLVH